MDGGFGAQWECPTLAKTKTARMDIRQKVKAQNVGDPELIHSLGPCAKPVLHDVGQVVLHASSHLRM